MQFSIRWQHTTTRPIDISCYKERYPTSRRQSKQHSISYQHRSAWLQTGQALALEELLLLSGGALADLGFESASQVLHYRVRHTVGCLHLVSLQCLALPCKRSDRRLFDPRKQIRCSQSLYTESAGPRMRSAAILGSPASHTSRQVAGAARAPERTPRGALSYGRRRARWRGIGRRRRPLSFALNNTKRNEQ